jgi:Sec-independent protein translocase protein TatA
MPKKLFLKVPKDKKDLPAFAEKLAAALRAAQKQQREQQAEEQEEQKGEDE